MFREQDIQKLKERGISPREAEQQIEYLRQGFPGLRLTGAATIQKGIKKLSAAQLETYKSLYEAQMHLNRMKFVPASGAATRMFKALFEFDELFRQSSFDTRILQKDAYVHVKECFDRMEDFAFVHELDRVVSRQGMSLQQALQKKNYHLILSSLLGREGMNYGNLPKGLLTFHRYGRQVRTAVEEHMVEGAGYATNADQQVRIHLTVSPEHRKTFEQLLDKVKPLYEEHFRVRYEIDFSIQKPATDTLAIDDKNEPFRETDGSLHFRPGGHGALLENLNDITADLIFIKNIDNVSHDRTRSDTLLYKKALAGLLVETRDKVFHYLELLEKRDTISDTLVSEIKSFLGSDLGTVVNSKLKNRDSLIDFLIARLNRPIRVCGMVKNTGEPGGGPFWTSDEAGNQSLQVVESSQVNHHDPEQEAILNSATHFNPVDLVCSVLNYKGAKFNLMNFRDPNTGFISKKFKNGKPLKAMELPGLWNGSMAHWNTVFVEVPVSTFTPVKTVHDLLRPEHQESL